VTNTVTGLFDLIWLIKMGTKYNINGISNRWCWTYGLKDLTISI